MLNFIKYSPPCPKCGGTDTYDMIPELPDEPNIQLSRAEQCLHEYSVGNAKYRCLACDYKWKKYRGRKPYQTIQKIFFNESGFPGLNYYIEIDLVENKVKEMTYFYCGENEHEFESEITESDKKWFLEELYTCDFMNWAERYVMADVLDGSHWILRIQYNTYCEIKQGTNYFPPKWKKFCQAIGKMGGMNGDYRKRLYD